MPDAETPKIPLIRIRTTKTYKNDTARLYKVQENGDVVLIKSPKIPQDRLNTQPSR